MENLRDVVAQNNTDFGPTLTAYMCSAADNQVVLRWASPSGPIPPAPQEVKLRTAHAVWQTLSDGAVLPEAALEWMTALHSELGMSPAAAVRAGEGNKVISAAAAFSAQNAPDSF